MKSCSCSLYLTQAVTCSTQKAVDYLHLVNILLEKKKQSVEFKPEFKLQI